MRMRKILKMMKEKKRKIIDIKLTQEGIDINQTKEELIKLKL